MVGILIKHRLKLLLLLHQWSCKYTILKLRIKRIKKNFLKILLFEILKIPSLER